MNLLLFVDLHNSDRALKELAQKAQKADVLVCGGDITIFGEGLSAIMKRLAELGKPIIIVHGNHESEQEMERACSKYPHIHDVHKKSLLFNGVLFQGYGGGGFSYTYPELEKLTKKFMSDRVGNEKSVFISHAPPYKTACDDIQGEPSGSKTLRELLIKLKPDIVICGHIHENAGRTDTLGKSLIINPGPLGKIVNI